MSRQRNEAAWADYWSSTGADGNGGCLPKSMPRVEALLAATWQSAARALPRGAKVLDLATGDGTVLQTIRKVRPDLKLIGVDSAAKLPNVPKGLHLRAGVAMEELPFGDRGFALVTSQFGFEYGDVERISAEVGRVVQSGGAFRFVMHHADSPIVSHNTERRLALAWAALESGLLERARALAVGRGRMDIPTPATFRGAVDEGRRLFPAQPVAAEFAGAVWQTLELGRRSAPRDSLQALDALETKALNEMTRIEALCAAASGADRLTVIASGLDAAGLRAEPASILHEEGSRKPLAWLLAGRKG